MRAPIVSKEALLLAAKKIAYRDGLSALSVRDTAAACGVSVGTVYNYFPAKADLVSAVMGDFWERLLRAREKRDPVTGRFTDFYKEFYTGLYSALENFDTGLLGQLSMLSEEEQLLGRRAQADSLAELKEELMAALEMDAEIPAAVWNEVFSKEEFVEFIYDNMLSMLRRGEADSAFFIELVKRLIYR